MFDTRAQSFVMFSLAAQQILTWNSCTVHEGSHGGFQLCPTEYKDKYIFHKHGDPRNQRAT